MEAVGSVECDASAHDRRAYAAPKILIVAASLRIMGGQAVMADRLIRGFRKSGVRADFLPINPKPPGVLHYAERVKYLRTLVISCFYILSLIRTVPRYDVLHIFSASYMSVIISQAPAILVGRLFGKPIILNYHSGECDDHLTSWAPIIYRLLRLVDCIVVPSDYLKAVFAKHGFEATTVANDVSEETFPFVARDYFRPKILVARMLDPIYNLSCSIRAFHLVKQQYPEAELTLLGDGPQEPMLRKLVADLQLDHVTFAGRVPRDRIASVYRTHDIFLNSSSIDNMPVSILEAYSSGLPVVTTNPGGIPFLVRDRETGHLVPVDDHQQLANRMLEVLHDQQHTQAIVHAAHDEINRRYRWSAVSHDWIDLYNQLAGVAPSA